MSDKIHISAWAAAVDDEGVIWMSHFGFNGLFKYDISSGIISSVGCFPDKARDAIELHHYAKCIGDYVYFAPLSDSYLRRVNRVTEEIETLSYPDTDQSERGSLAFGDNLIYYKAPNGNMFIHDPQTDSFCPDSRLVDIVKDYSEILDPEPMEGSFYQDRKFSMDYQDGRMILWYRNKVCIINPDKYESQITDTGDMETFQIFINGDDIWITHAYDFDIGRYNIASGQYRLYKGDRAEWKDIEEEDFVRPYSRLCFAGDSVIIPNYHAKLIYAIDETNSRVVTSKSVFDNTKLTRWSRKNLYPDYYTGLIYDNKAYLIPCGRDKIIVYDINNHDYEYRNFEINKRDISFISEYYDEQFQYSTVIEDGELSDLESLIMFVTKNNA